MRLWYTREQHTTLWDSYHSRYHLQCLRGKLVQLGDKLAPCRTRYTVCTQNWPLPDTMSGCADGICKM
jgi:hypothetical protein